MKIATATLWVLLGFSSAHAQGNDNTALRNAATGKQFTIGNTAFRMVPGVSLQRHANPPGDESIVRSEPGRAKVDSNAPKVLGSVGPYLIVPRGSASAAAATAPSTSDARHSNTDDLAVAVNLRSGLPAVVTPRLKVYAEKPGDIVSAAKQTGGHVVYASDADGSGLIRYETVDATQSALDAVTKAPGIRGASIDVIEQFKQKM